MSNNNATLNKHRESIINPGEYSHVAEFYQGPSEEMQHAFAGENAYVDQLVGGDWSKIEFHRNGGCAHCGAHFFFGSVFEHPVHGYVATGHTCASERFSFDSNIKLRAELARKRGDAARKNAQIKLKFQLWVESRENGLADAFKVDHYIIKDIRRKGEQYGSISERQEELVLKIAREEAEKAAQKEEANEVEVPSVPVIEGRYVIEGKVVSTKWQESYYGDTFKMLVEVTTDEGAFRVWGTVPAALSGVDRGDVVRFTAAVEQSNKDESFGFYKRPSKAEFVSQKGE